MFCIQKACMPDSIDRFGPSSEEGSCLERKQKHDRRTHFIPRRRSSPQRMRVIALSMSNAAALGPKNGCFVNQGSESMRCAAMRPLHGGGAENGHCSAGDEELPNREENLRPRMASGLRSLRKHVKRRSRVASSPHIFIQATQITWSTTNAVPEG